MNRRFLVPFSIALLAAPNAFAQAPAPSDAPSAKPAAEPVIAPLPEGHPLLPALATIRADDLRADEAWLADDARKGRCAGEKSNDEAADWIAARFREYGLKPFGDKGSFLQRFDFRVRGGDGGKAKTQNVVALWPGSDPSLKGEVVVLGAHFDHVGTAESFDAGRIGGPVGDDTIWNGADDNASGTSTLLEVAQAFASSGLRCKRSLLFIAFSAEEQGLFGSQWYCSHPTVPLAQTRAMLNMDMVGRNPEQPIEMAAIGSLKPGLWKSLIDAARGAAPSLVFTLKDGYLPDSDHASFLAQKIPTTFVYTGEHRDYHRPTDTSDKLAFDRMEQIGRFATALAWRLADGDEELAWTRPAFEGGPQPRRLGVSTEGALTAARAKELGVPDGQGGYEVTGLDPDGVGAAAGMKDGDVILSIGGTPLDSADALRSLRRLIRDAKANEPVAIVVLRAKEKVTLTAKWEE